MQCALISEDSDLKQFADSFLGFARGMLKGNKMVKVAGKANISVLQTLLISTAHEIAGQINKNYKG